MENISRASKSRRLFYTPFKYIFSVIFRLIIYRITGKELRWRTRLFWGAKATIALPASTDLFLLGCKTHPSEIRLTRFILKNLKEGNFFADIGSHIGFYSLLASFCVGKKGKVMSVEASPASFLLLKSNISKCPNIEAFNIALSDQDEVVEFVEFPGSYTEYSTTEPEQFEGEPWFTTTPHNKILITAKPGDKLLERYAEMVTIIKIDVEGAEIRVIRGLKYYLDKMSPVVVMEFLSAKRNNASHREADNLLRSLGYSAYRIGDSGELFILDESANDYIENSDIESDNIVYRKQKT
ncbi:MAG: FkbM family methyltransferase [Bacteroidota bacterium]|nr:FkbM family methyltransferase [Bacteroidota bacterium]